ncbi:MAG: hypothetical protein HOW97_02475 [Catenulispora sp.]|nr:hypothetical protein [Catenulispora sp.]
MTATAEAPEQAVHPAWDGFGVYPDLPAADYHADIAPGGSLSSTGARKLLVPSCPAKFQYERLHGQKPKKVFDYGTAAHQVVLGNGPELVIFDRPRWDTDAIKAEIAEARASGAIPLKPHEHAQIMAMADALRRHPEAAPLLEPDSGEAEQSLFWKDPGTGITCRARIDWWRHDGEPVDYKSARSAEPQKFEKDSWEHGYPQQDDWYCAGLEALGYADEHTTMRFVVQEKEPPYVVTVARFDLEARRIARLLNETSRHLYARCMETGHWPGYSETTELISLPPYIERLFN